MGPDNKAPLVCVASLGEAQRRCTAICAAMRSGELSAHQKAKWLSGELWAPKGPSAWRRVAKPREASRCESVLLDFTSSVSRLERATPPGSQIAPPAGKAEA